MSWMLITVAFSQKYHIIWLGTSAAQQGIKAKNPSVLFSKNPFTMFSNKTSFFPASSYFFFNSLFYRSNLLVKASTKINFYTQIQNILPHSSTFWKWYKWKRVLVFTGFKWFNLQIVKKKIRMKKWNCQARWVNKDSHRGQAIQSTHTMMVICIGASLPFYIVYLHLSK